MQTFIDQELQNVVDLSANCVRVANHFGAPTEREFARIVRQRQPVLFKNAVSHWPALEKWSDEHLSRVLGENKISVSLTPNGRADAIDAVEIDGQSQHCFLLPLTREMTFGEFLRCVDERKHVAYIQEQNSSFSSEFNVLREDICLNDNASNMPFEFAAHLFGEPDAINFWCGTEKSQTSLHKDPYDNLYAVVRGQKHFLLFPPCDAALLPETEVSVAQWHLDSKNDEWSASLVADTPPIDWIDVNNEQDVLNLPSSVSAMRVTVESGDVLFLPALWFHQVSQSVEFASNNNNENATKLCVAVNCWFDTPGNSDFALQRLLANLKKYSARKKNSE